MLLRITLAFIIVQQGIGRFLLSDGDAVSFELPLFVWAVASVDGIFIGVALILGGMLHKWKGDLL